jgi:hypothetical protein
MIEEDEMGGACSTHENYERLLIIGGKAREKETTREAKT